MFLSLSFIVLSLIATAFAFNETSEYAENFSYSIQKPYDKNLSERYSLSSGVHHFWVYDDDKPHSTTSNTEPRTEMRINNDYRSGIHTFDGDVMIPSGTTGANVFQVFGGNAYATAVSKLFPSHIIIY